MLREMHYVGTVNVENMLEDIGYCIEENIETLVG